MFFVFFWTGILLGYYNIYIFFFVNLYRDSTPAPAILKYAV